MTIELFPPKDTGGSDIISFELWRDQGTPNSAFILVPSFTGASMTHTLTVSTDSLVTGNIYQLKFRAKNVIGYSPYSLVLRVSLSQKIPAPTNLRAILENTGATYITFAWDMVVYPEQPTQGYTVEMLIDSQWIEVKNAQYDQNYLQFTMFGLTAGTQYTFRVFSSNFNGKSDPSETITIYACGVPSGMAEPKYVASDKTSITIQWQAPTYQGGCPIYDYAVYRDNKGAESAWENVNPQPPYIRNDPYTF